MTCLGGTMSTVGDFEAQMEALATDTDDPVRHAQEALGLSLWEKQGEICRAIASSPKVACKTGHKCGVTTASIAAALWFADTRRDPRVVLIAPHDPGVFNLRRSLRELRPKAGPLTFLATRDPMAMAGISDENVLFVVDYAASVDDEVFEAIEGNVAGGARVLLTGVPHSREGQFFRAFHQESQEWELLTISSEESPNVVEGKAVIPGLATAGWIERCRRLWGAEDARYQVRVLGEFPKEKPTTEPRLH